jgi:ATP-dependent DNA helicase RecG
VIVDEQHRFGVKQRAKLVKGNGEKTIPHVLSMTATPIPRTLALTIYGDLDLSLIDELPKGRKKIITKIVPPEERKKSYQFIKKEIKKGRQAFVICPRIESKENEKNPNWNEAKAVKEEYKNLSEKIFKEFTVDMLHGKMPAKEKERAMKNFKNKKTDILVSTSVVEVGIDVPSATIMMIEGSDRFGLAQLHQFRGRVGRSKKQSYCFLLTDSSSVKTKQRLQALVNSEDGFKLAEKDLKIRGPGDFVGIRQWGIPDLAMESLKDIREIEKTRTKAKEILEKDPQLKKFPLLRREVSKIGEKIYLG